MNRSDRNRMAGRTFAGKLTRRLARATSPSTSLTKLTNENHAVGKIPANPRPHKSRSAGQPVQFNGREALQNSAPEVPADQTIAGEGREHADGETGKPMTFDIDDQHGPFSCVRECREEPLRVA